ncbi:MAG: carboxypeptidase regulatory-like domain-containing protein [Flavobacterium sp.]|nr:carboxypeptidase regulatory-like domain-containing protein [Flavobacterium sp.]
MSFKHSYFVLFFVLFSSTVVSAQKASIKGSVVDFQNQSPIEYASIALINSVDNLVVAGEVSNKNGNFTIQNIKPGTYALKINGEVILKAYQKFFKTVILKSKPLRK